MPRGNPQQKEQVHHHSQSARPGTGRRYRNFAHLLGIAGQEDGLRGALKEVRLGHPGSQVSVGLWSGIAIAQYFPGRHPSDRSRQGPAGDSPRADHSGVLMEHQGGTPVRGAPPQCEVQNDGRRDLRGLLIPRRRTDNPHLPQSVLQFLPHGFPSHDGALFCFRNSMLG